ncbi:hypothetical protein JTE90_012037 [Oedothorax gibbosus]|uniref:Reverse transcriptase domain-containing protein n=1 Tax=Oedothorax gibbosus TaxID=931172 RepID=A0AAV6TIF8_9ARAC|nr:hypothetical protein JTE90_012037 [Oedothorax gibbosus]
MLPLAFPQFRPLCFHLGPPPFPPWPPRCGPAVGLTPPLPAGPPPLWMPPPAFPRPAPGHAALPPPDEAILAMGPPCGQGNLPMLGDCDDGPSLIGDLAPIGPGPVAPPPSSPGDDPPGEPTDDVDWDDGVPPAIFPDDRLLFLGDARPSFFQQKWIDIFINISSIEALDDQITIYTAELQQALRRPARRGRRRRPPITAAVPPILADALGRQGAQSSTFFNNGLSMYDKEAATKLQRDFNLMPGRTVDAVLHGGREPCPIPAERLVAHFGEVYSSRPHSHEFVFSDFPAPDPASNEVLLAPYSKEEVWKKLLNSSNSAPGPDLIPYSILKAKDPGALILTTICRAVQIFGVVPDAWRKANIVLAHKAGDRDDVSNWRPIALLNTMGKVFSGCLADRLDDWGNKNHVLSPQQKGFREFEGCLEHNFLIQHMLSQARSSKSDLFLAWLDLENAFGAVPHSLILESLTHIGVPPQVIEMIKALYTNARCKIRLPEGLSDAIPMEAGVRQGCPLSSVLFNFTIEHMLRAVSGDDARGIVIQGSNIKFLAYADDILLAAPSAEDLSQHLNVISDSAEKAGLRFKPRKCATLGIRNAPRARGTLPNTFLIQGHQVPFLRNDEAYKYLGVKVGYNPKQDYHCLVDLVCDQIDLIHNSLLAPWQMLQAIRGHILPRIEFLSRNLALKKKDVLRIDKKIQSRVKSILNLPQRADANIVRVAIRKGGAGVQSLSDTVDIDHITYAMKMLSSKDQLVREAASQSLKEAVRKKAGVDPTDDNIFAYLSGSLPVPRSGGGVAGSVWSNVRAACLRLNKKFPVSWSRCSGTGMIKITIGHISSRSTTTITQSSRAYLFRQLKSAMSDYYLERISAKPDQGKTAAPVSLHPASSAFIADGSFTRFCDWRFIHRARLGVLPLNGTRRFGNQVRKCRRCGFVVESIPHVINHCTSHSATWNLRHNEIQDRIVRAIPSRSGTVTVNRRVPDTTLPLRPDIVVRRPDGSLLIIDVTVPFEDRVEALVKARRIKINKYQPLVDELATKGITASVDAIIVGALGSWDTCNDYVLGQLGVSRKYATMMRKIICARTIGHSRNIYVSHITGSPQSM